MAAKDTVNLRKRYRGRVRADLVTVKRHLEALVRNSKQARVGCSLVAAIDAGGVYPGALLDGAVEGTFTTVANIIGTLLKQKRSAGPTCLSAGVFAP